MTTVHALVAAFLVAAGGAWAAWAIPAATQSVEPPPSSPAIATTRPIGAELLIPGELMDKLDSKTAKVGDHVVIRTKSAAHLADGLEIPKGSKLIGRVTGVEPVGVGNADAQIALEFDRAELKDGKSLPMRGEIQALASAQDAPAADPMSAVPNSAPAGRASGDMYGSTPTMAPPSQVPNQTQAGGSASSVVGSGTAPGAVIAHSGDIIIRTTAIPGLLLANHEQSLHAAQPSSILLGARRDIHLENGTHLVVAVALSATPAAAN